MSTHSGIKMMLLYAVFLISSVLAQDATTSRPASPVMTTHVEISTTIPLWTDFDLFKNTGFTPCLINSNKSADPTTKDFFVTRQVSSQEEFCSFMAGTPIMIPTVPNKVAFFPWYPTMMVQAFSLLWSYIGLFYILRRVNECRNSGETYKRPKWFWGMLAVDLARCIAFFYTVAHGFSDPTHFAWVSVMFWLLPLNYVTVGTQIRVVTQSARLFAAAAATYEEPYSGAALQLRQHLQMRASRLLGRTLPSRGFGSDTITPIRNDKQNSLRFTASSGEFPSLASVAGDFVSTNRRQTTPSGSTVWAWIILTSAAWFLTFVTTILHWKWNFSKTNAMNAANGVNGTSANAANTNGTSPAVPSSALASSLYSQITTSLTNPTQIGNMPVSCLSFLSGGNLLLQEGGGFFAEPAEDLPAFAILATLQFVLGTATVLAAIYWLFLRRQSRPMYPQFVSSSPYAAAAFAHDEQLAQALSWTRTKTLLLLSCGMTLFFLLVPAFALGMEIVAKVKSGRVGLRFTNDLAVTGGCTFAFVDMDKRGGYWDVSTELGERIVMAFLGVA
jgi:hypothetical protein